LRAGTRPVAFKLAQTVFPGGAGAVHQSHSFQFLDTGGVMGDVPFLLAATCNISLFDPIS
jgi:hypothetical protein